VDLFCPVFTTEFVGIIAIQTYNSDSRLKKWKNINKNERKNFLHWFFLMLLTL